MYGLPLSIAGHRKINQHAKQNGLSLMHDEPTLITFLLTSSSKIACYYCSKKKQLAFFFLKEQRSNLLLDNAKKCLSNLDFLEANEASVKEGLTKQIPLFFLLCK